MSNSRLEKFIYAICSMEVSDLPAPLSRIEILWNCLITGETPDFEPQSRNEQYLMAMLGLYELENLPTPMSRGEKLLYKIAMGETDLSDIPAYLSRYEELLGYLAENGGVGDFEYILQTLNQRLSTLYSTKERPMKQAVIKGDTLVNELPRPSLKNTMTNATSQKLNHGCDNGKMLVNIISSINKQTYNVTDFNLSSIDKTKTYFIKFDADFEVSEVGFLINVDSWNTMSPISPRTRKGYVKLKPDKARNIIALRIRFDGNTDTSYIPTVKVICIEYQDGMENWDIPYFEGTKTFSTTPNVVDGEFEQAVVKGQTLVNIKEGVKEVQDESHIKEFYIPTVKVNTTYLIKYNVESSDPNVTDLAIGFLKNVGTWSNNTENGPLNGTIILNSGNDPYYFRINGKIKTSTLTVNSLMIIEYQEGMENWDIPYFEGMQSVQLSEVKTTGKNLFDKENVVNGIFMSGSLSISSTNTNLTIGKDNAIKVEPNTHYTFSFATGWKIGALGLNATKTAITIDTKWQTNSNGYTFTTDANTNYVTFNIEKTGSSIIQPSDMDNAKLMLEKGSVATPYEPYQSNTLTLAEPVNLRKVGDVEDEFDALTGQVTERVGEIVLDGTLTYYQVNSRVDTELYQPFYIDSVGNVLRDLKPTIKVKSDKIKCVNGSTSYTQLTEECIYQYTDESASFAGCLLKSTLNGLSVREWFRQNNVRLQYTYASPVIKTLDLTITDQDGSTQSKLHSFNDGHLLVSSQGLLPSAVNYEVPTNNSYYLPDMLTLGAQYTSRGSADCNATIDGKLLALGKNGTFTTPSSVTDKLMVLDAPVDDLMFIKGDHTAKDFGYFEGMKSVVLSNKLPVLKTTNFIELYTTDVERKDGFFISDTDGTDSQMNGYSVTDFIELPDGNKNIVERYTNHIAFYDKSKTYIRRIATWQYVESSHEIPTGAKYARIQFENKSVPSFDDVVFGLGTKIVEKEAIKSNILTVNEDVVLRGIGNVQDELDCLKGQVTERIGEVVLNGSEGWVNTLYSTTDTICYDAPITKEGKIYNQYSSAGLISDKLPSRNWIHFYSDKTNEEGIVLGRELGATIHFKINRNKLSSQDVYGVRAYLKSNPITVQYQLATESVKTVDLTTVDQDGQPTKLKTFNDISYVEINADNIIPSVDLEVATKISETLSTMGPQQLDISETQNQLGQTIDEQAENTDATMMATTEIYEQTL